jgi:hypothetical protein
MSYLTQYAVARPAARRGARVDEHTVLNLQDFDDGGAHVRAFVEDTSNRRVRRRRLPSPRLKLRITDCTNEIHLEFSVNSPELRENRHARLPVRDLRRGFPGLGPLAAARRRPLVCGTARRRDRLPGGQVPAARRRHAPRPPAAGAPGRAGELGQPDPRGLGRARASLRVDRPRRCRRSRRRSRHDL